MNTLKLDKETLYNFYGNSPEEIAEMLKDYLHSNEETIKSFKEAYKKGLVPLQSCIHFHSSVFAYVGFPQLTDECRQFEQECKNTNTINAVASTFSNFINRIYESAVIAKKEIELLNMSRYNIAS